MNELSRQRRCRIEVDLELLQVLAYGRAALRSPQSSSSSSSLRNQFPCQPTALQNVAFQVLGAAGAPRGRRSAARISGGPTRKKSTYPSSSRLTDSSEFTSPDTASLAPLIGREFRGATHPSEMIARARSLAAAEEMPFSAFDSPGYAKPREREASFVD